MERPACTVRVIVPEHPFLGQARALAVVDAEAVLEIAERAVRLAMIAQRRAARLDRLQKHLLDRACEPRERRRRAA